MAKGKDDWQGHPGVDKRFQVSTACCGIAYGRHGMHHRVGTTLRSSGAITLTPGIAGRPWYLL